MVKTRSYLFQVFMLLTLSLAQDAFCQPDYCAPVDLRQALGPNREQGNIGWCYAEVAADLLTYRFRSEMKGQRVSAGYIALTYNESFFQHPNFEGGFAEIATFQAQRQGFCPEAIEKKMENLGPQLPVKQKINQLINFKRNFDLTDGQSMESDLRHYYSVNHSTLTSMPEQDLRGILANSTENNFVKNLADYECRSSRIYPKSMALPWFGSKYFSLGNTTPLIWEIHRQLNKNNIIAASYYADFFDKDNAPSTKNGRHVSVVVGRRWNQEKNSCEFLIRNSWGSKCSSYKAASLQVPGACESGNIWVSEGVLKKNIFGVNFLTAKGYTFPF